MTLPCRRVLLLDAKSGRQDKVKSLEHDPELQEMFEAESELDAVSRP